MCCRDAGRDGIRWIAFALMSAFIAACGQPPVNHAESSAQAPSQSPVERGKYLVTISGCHDCHTTKKMGPNGPEPDMSRMLAGHPEDMKMPAPPVIAPDAPWAFPPLAGNRVVTQSSPVNLVRWVLDGGFGPSTAAHPQPWGMPPFRSQLSDEEIAAVASHLRQAWGHRAGGVSALDVQRLR